MANRLAVFAVLMVAILLCSCKTPSTREHPFQLGETRIQTRVTHGRELSPTMVNVHDDENTSVRAGKVVIRESGGRLIELTHRGKRLVEFQLAGQTYRFMVGSEGAGGHLRFSVERILPVALGVTIGPLGSLGRGRAVTVGGTVATAWSLDSATVTGDDAGPDSVTLPVAVLPPAMLVGVT